MKKNNFNLRIEQIISSFKLMKKNKVDFNKSADLMLKTLRKKIRLFFVEMGGLSRLISCSCRAGW